MSDAPIIPPPPGFEVGESKTWTGTRALEAINAGLPPGHYGDDEPEPRRATIVTNVDTKTGTVTLGDRRFHRVPVDAARVLDAREEAEIDRAVEKEWSKLDQLFSSEYDAANYYLGAKEALFDRHGYGAPKHSWRASFAWNLYESLISIGAVPA